LSCTRKGNGKRERTGKGTGKGNRERDSFSERCEGVGVKNFSVNALLFKVFSLPSSLFSLSHMAQHVIVRPPGHQRPMLLNIPVYIQSMFSVKVSLTWPSTSSYAHPDTDVPFTSTRQSPIFSPQLAACAYGVSLMIADPFLVLDSGRPSEPEGKRRGRKKETYNLY
jgi:hypothetical protein